MDSVNTKIGQFTAKEAATVVHEKAFNAAQLVGLQTGASVYSAGSNANVVDQVRFADKTQTELGEKLSADKRFKRQLDESETTKQSSSVEISPEVAASISDIFGARGTELDFSVDSGTAKQVVTVTDKGTGDVIRQIPSEEMLKFAAKVQEISTGQNNAVGILIDRQA